MPEDWSKASVVLTLKKEPGSYKQVSLDSVPGNMMEQLILETIAGHAKYKKVIRNSHHRLINGKSCSSNLTAFCHEVAAIVDQGRAVAIFCLEKGFCHCLPLSY